MAWNDARTWIQGQLTAAFPGWVVTPEADNVRLGSYPAAVWSLSLENPGSLGIWTGNLTVSVLCDPDTAADRVAAMHTVVEGWQTPGPINSVTLVSNTASRGPSGADRNIHQYVLVYSLLWDNII